MKLRTKETDESRLLKLNYEISKLLSSTTPLEHTLDKLLSICCKVEGIDCGTLYLADSLTDGLKLVSHHGMRARLREKHASYDFTSLETRRAKKAEPMYLSTAELKEHMYSTREMKHGGLQYFISIPVVYDNNVVAVINLFSFELKQIKESTRIALEAFAMRAGALIARVNAIRSSQESEQRYRSLLETMNEGFLIIDENYTVIYGNNRICEMLGYRFEEIIGLPVSFFFNKKNKLILQSQIRRKKSKGALSYEITWQKSDGKEIITRVATRAILDDNRHFRGSFAVIADVTEIKRTDAKLRENEQALIDKTTSLQEVNTALHVLLKKRDADKKEIEEKVISNIEQLIIPLLNKIRERSLDPTQKSLFDILESSISSIASPFAKNIFAKHLELTSTEFDIANFIREGKSTKEISEIMSLSPRTVETHRFRIRKKLKLNNQKIGLRSYLLSLQ